jgi:hypothetical protein
MTTKNKQGDVIRTVSRRRRAARNQVKTYEKLTHFSKDTNILAQAITNPFADDALGAVIPDQWSPPSMAAMDRLSIDVDLEILHTDDLLIDGIVFYFVPRSLAVGWLARIGPLATSPSQTVLIPLTADFTGAPPIEDDPVAHLYCLFMGILGTASAFNSPTIMALDPQQGGYVHGYNVIPFSRFSALDASASGARICGAGIKVFSNEAPIETGGSVYGGWASIDDIFKSVLQGPPVTQTVSSPVPILSSLIQPRPSTTAGSLPRAKPVFVRSQGMMVEVDSYDEFERMSLTRQTAESNSNSNSSPRRSTPALTRRQRLQEAHRHRRLARLRGAGDFDAINLQDMLRYRHTFRGIDGCTVRYSPLQSSVQETFQPIYDVSIHYAQTNPEDIQVNFGTSIGAKDIIGCSDYVPAVLWRYNGDSESYNLRLECRVHLQVEPDGDCPFMSSTVTPDPHYNDLQIILENKDAFPVVAKGNSFRSFNVGLREAMKTVGGALHLFGQAKRALF